MRYARVGLTTGLLIAAVLAQSGCRRAEAEPPERVDLAVSFIRQDTAGVTVSWRNPADDGNGPLDSAIVRYGRVISGTFQPQDTSAFRAVGFGANQTGLVLIELGALQNTLRACVAMKRRALTGSERCGDLQVTGPDIPPPPPDTVGLSSAAPPSGAQPLALLVAFSPAQIAYLDTAPGCEPGAPLGGCALGMRGAGLLADARFPAYGCGIYVWGPGEGQVSVVSSTGVVPSHRCAEELPLLGAPRALRLLDSVMQVALK